MKWLISTENTLLSMKNIKKINSDKLEENSLGEFRES